MDDYQPIGPFARSGSAILQETSLPANAEIMTPPLLAWTVLVIALTDISSATLTWKTRAGGGVPERDGGTVPDQVMLRIVSLYTLPSGMDPVMNEVLTGMVSVIETGMPTEPLLSRMTT